MKNDRKEMTCIVCPIGCRLTVERSDGGEVLSVEGNTCPRGKKYAISELTNPVRTLASTVRVTGGAENFLPVKTVSPIPKPKLFEAMAKLKTLTVKAPISVGQIIASDVAGADIVACKSIAGL